MSKKAVRNTTGGEVADYYEVQRQTVLGWAHRGCPHTRTPHGHLYNLKEVAAWLDANNLTGEMGRPASELSPDRKAARLRKELALAEKHELANEKERALLVSAAEAAKQWRALVGLARRAFMAIPQVAARECEGQTAAGIQAVLDRHVHAVLVHLSGGQGGRL